MKQRATKKQNFYDLLEAIRKRPGLYLRSPTLDSLYDFLTGFSVGQYFGLCTDESERDFSDFSAWFCFHLHAPCAGPDGWYGAIRNESGSRKEGFGRFFEYLTTYRQRPPVLEYRFTLTPAQQRFYEANRRTGGIDQLRLTRYKGERCLFLHTRRRGQHGWYLHAAFHSLVRSRPSLAKTFGITDTQWKRAKRHRLKA